MLLKEPGISTAQLLDHHTCHLFATVTAPDVWSTCAHQQLAEMQSLTHLKHQVLHDTYSVWERVYLNSAQSVGLHMGCLSLATLLKHTDD